MKKLLMITGLFLFAAFSINAQTDEAVELTQNYTIENVTAHDLMLNSYDWVLTYFENPGFRLVTETHSNTKIDVNAEVIIAGTLVTADYIIEIDGSNVTFTIKNLSNQSQTIQDYFNQLQTRFEFVLKSKMTDAAKAAIEEKI